MRLQLNWPWAFKDMTMGKKSKKHRKGKNMGAPAYGSLLQHNTLCHTSPTKVLTIGSADIYAGRWVAMNPIIDWGLRIRMNDGYALGNGTKLIRASHGALDMFSEKVTDVNYPPTLDIDWSDFDAPIMDHTWWRALINDLEKLGPIDVGLYCQGGHGRTGTALSILASLGGIIPEDYTGDCVQWVRDRYCEEAVESWSQCDYIEEITGEALDSKPSSLFRMQQSHHWSPKITAETSIFNKETSVQQQVKNLANGNTASAPVEYVVEEVKTKGTSDS